MKVESIDQEKNRRNKVWKLCDLLTNGDEKSGLNNLRQEIWNHKKYPKTEPDFPSIALAATIKSGSIKGFEALLEEGLIDKKTKQDIEPAIIAVCTLRTPMLKALVTYGFKLSGTSKDGRSPLNIACRYGSLGAVNTLFKAGVNPDTKSFSDIGEAACLQKKDVVALILNQYKLQLLSQISKGEVKPIDIMQTQQIDPIKKWGKRDPTQLYKSASTLIEQTATRLLKEKRINRTIELLRKEKELENM